MTIAIEQEERGEFRVLALSGRLDTETSADLELALQDLQAAGATHFVIDLANIGYVSSAGLRVLLALAKQLDGGRGVLRLCSLNEAVRQVFDVAGFSRMFAIFPSRDAALGAAGAAAKPAPRPAPAPAPPKAAEAAPASEPARAPEAVKAAAPARPAERSKPVEAAKPPEPAKPAEPTLAQQAAGLLGAGDDTTPPGSAAADLARAAAQLLVGESKPAREPASPKPPKLAPPAAAAPPPTEAPREPSGMLGKFRNLFGKK